ncbi:histidine ammonia-lyase [Hoeflea marina]|uniref:Histidine ammonia-lyase n=1 Tax=Hoeflea marina TaxID=274592 RepID=A0A317PQI2_9HYPH|nr:histidine ammonia-lyase [Hoeflea marina]PWW03723.1 histidine ammonia-lyase [Hoeflea marina]
MTSDRAVTLALRAPTVSDIVAVARNGARLSIAPELMTEVARGRSVIDKYIASDVAVYGLTTGLGAGVDTRLDAADLISFQRRVPQARSVGVGPALSREETRAVMAVRAAGFAAGGSGVSPSVFAALVDALNADFVPVVPSLGSIGAADLAPLAHIAGALMGAGEVALAGEILPAADALAKAGLRPVELAARDGHALVVGNALSTGLACLALDDLERLIEWSLAAIALNFEAFRANVSAFDERALSRRPAFGQVEAAARLRAFLTGSALNDEGAARRLQDPLSFRCTPQIWGALLHAADEARQATEIELAGVGDNPVILVDEGLILANGNFDTTAFALSFERLGLAIAHCAAATAHRTMKIMSPGISELPRFLTPLGASRNGFATAQKTVSALEAEIRHLANPVSFSPIPVADGIEDHASLAPSVVAKTAAIIERFTYLVAIELLAAAQAVDLRGVEDRLGAGASFAYRRIRDCVSPLAEDRALGPDFQLMADVMRTHSPGA